MSDRIALSIEVAHRAQGSVRVFPLTEGRLEALRRGDDRLPFEVDAAFGERLRSLLALTRFQAGAGSHLPVLEADDRLLVLFGLGRETSRRTVREAAATACSIVPSGVAWSFHVPPPSHISGLTHADLLAAAWEGVALGPYQFRTTQRPPSSLAGAACIVTEVEERAARAIADRTRALVEGVLLARDLVNTPAEDLGPAELAEAALAVARRHGMEARVLHGADVEAAGFRLTHRVGRASHRPPALVFVEHRLEGDRDPAVALLGKGVVFDTGGLDIKTGGNMQLMRKDMGGAGAVIGALEAVGRLAVETPFLTVIPCVENAVGPLSMRPGDVIRAFDGQTVEIGNTDAEGRLLLADALGYARERRSERIVDAATLTGAARLALGPDLPALFGTDEQLVATLLDLAAKCDEPMWRLPLVDRYEGWIETPFADVNNASGDRRAGAITAALFLRRFAKLTPWAHIDVYAWEDRGAPGTPRGANGMGVKTLAEFLLGLT